MMEGRRKCGIWAVTRCNSVQGKLRVSLGRGGKGGLEDGQFLVGAVQFAAEGLVAFLLRQEFVYNR